uniref:phosphoribosylglycinamide formyltransferase 1 n=1 Tax=Geobacter sp. (strain M21) TaxID=443144 RepID=C6DZW2_GEOSM
MSTLSVVMVVSSDPSDIYFANQLARRLGAAAVVMEDQQVPVPMAKRVAKLGQKLLRPWEIPGLLRERRIVAEHVRRSSAIDRAGFGDDGYRLQLPDSCRVIRVSGKNSVNLPATVAAVRELAPDLLLLCGCSIVKQELLSVPRLGALNLHGGLAQKYRGVWTTLWAVVNREPEYVGATVHFVSAGIDDGDIIFQGRPGIEAGDDPESLYVKVVKLGVEMMVAAVGSLASGEVRRYRLEERGELYLSRMVTPAVLEKAWLAIEDGVIPAYLAAKNERDQPVVACMRGYFSP